MTQIRTMTTTAHSMTTKAPPAAPAISLLPNPDDRSEIEHFES